MLGTSTIRRAAILGASIRIQPFTNGGATFIRLAIKDYGEYETVTTLPVTEVFKVEARANEMLSAMEGKKREDRNRTD